MSEHKSMAGELQPRAGTVLDPVCGMFVDPQKARASAEHTTGKYFFCSSRCADRFRAEPDRYLAAKPKAPSLVQLGGIKPAASPPQAQNQGTVTNRGTVTYVCPMDPEVSESQAGPCPKCGMALEPEAVEYTCPMHPEIVRDRPGTCPICGMALEPRVAVGVHPGDERELRSMTRRF